MCRLYGRCAGRVQRRRTASTASAATGALFPLASALVLAAAGPASTRASGATMAVAAVGVLVGPLTIGTLAEDAGLRTALAAAAVLPVTALAVLAVRRR